MTRRTAYLLVVTSIALTALPACSWWNDVTYPVPPTSDGSDETPIAFEHHVQISWDSTDLALLESLDVQYPAQVSIVPSGVPSGATSAGGDELSVQLHFDVEKANNEAYSKAYLQQIEAASNLDSQNAQIHVPAPQELCNESRDVEGKITSLQGICVREMVISVPASHPIPISVAAGGDFSASGASGTSSLNLPSLQLTLADATQSVVENLSGNLTVSGGGPSATLTVSQLGNSSAKTGNLTLLLNAIQSAKLSQIGGSVSISITHPPTQAGAITLDGTAITSFPYTRP